MEVGHAAAAVDRPAQAARLARGVRLSRLRTAAVLALLLAACSRHALRQACYLNASNGAPMIERAEPVPAGVLVVRLTSSDTVHLAPLPQLRVRKLEANAEWIVVSKDDGAAAYHVAVDPEARYELRASGLGLRPRHDTLPSLKSGLSLILPMQAAYADACDGVFTYRERKPWWQPW